MGSTAPVSESSSSPVFVLGLDGLSHSLVKELFNRNLLKSLQKLCKDGRLTSLTGVIPPVSNVSWTSFFTGVNPGQHGIFGFVDRTPDPFRLFLCDGQHRNEPALWENLAQTDRKSILVNVTGSSPPGKLKGIWVGGMMSQTQDEICTPTKITRDIEECEYTVDVDPGLVHENPSDYLHSLQAAMKARFRLALRILEREGEWQFFQLNITETDRLGHFFLQDRDRFDSPYRDPFFDFYAELNAQMERLWTRIPQPCLRVVVSEHGMRHVQKHVDLNMWLQENEYLELSSGSDTGVESMTERSRAYSLLPGRIYINLQGREEKGSVPTDKRQSVVDQLMQELETFKEPGTGDPVIKEVYTREQIYRGDQIERAPDMIALPAEGYDFYDLETGEIVGLSAPHQGAHSTADAFLATDYEGFSEADTITEIGAMLSSYFD